MGGKFNKSAAVYWSHSGTERLSRDICISLRSGRLNTGGKRERGSVGKGRFKRSELDE